MTSNQCKYVKTCSVYLGEEKVNETPLDVYKNVFCNRGFKGWNNCKHFIKYDSEEQVKEDNTM